MTRRTFEPTRAAAAIADGAPVDWDALAAGASEPDRAALRQLSIIAAIARRARAEPRRHPFARARWPLDRIAGLLAATAGARVAIALACFAAMAVQHRGWPAPVRPAHLLVVAIFGASAFVLLRQNRGDARAADLGAFFLLVASAFANGLYGPMAGEVPFARTALAGIHVDGFLPYFFWRFVRGFPIPATGTIRSVCTGAIGLALSAGAVLTAATAAAVFFDGTAAGEFAERAARRSAKGTIYWTAVFALLLPALPLLAWRSVSSGAGARRRGVLFLSGMLLGFLPLSLTIVLETVSPAIRAWSAAHAQAVRTLATAFLLTIPLTTAYAVLVARVLDVRVMVKRTVQYALARTTILALALVPFGFLLVRVYADRALPVAVVFGSGNVRALAALAMTGAILLRLRVAMLRRLDRVFSRTLYEPEEALASMLEDARRSATLDELAPAVIERMTSTLGLESASLMVVGAKGGLYPVAGRIGPLADSGALRTVAAASTTPLYVDLDRPSAALRRLPDDDLFWLADHDVRALVPIHDSHGSLLAALALGPAKSDEPLADAHGALITALGAGLAAPIEQRLRAGGQPRTDGMAAQSERAFECAACGMVPPQDVHVCPRCGADAIPAAVPRVLAGKFRIVQRLGRGGMGVVYLATDTTLGRAVAVKTLPTVSVEHAIRLRREARTMAGFSHPNLATLYGIETWRGTPVLVVEYLGGGTLADRMRRGRLALPEWLPIAGAILSALSHIHAKGVLHRDIKPSNIGFTADGTPKLLDFGLAQLVTHALGEAAAVEYLGDPASDASLLLTDRRAGTPCYLSPEAIRGGALEPSADLWSTAIVMLEALGGAPAFADAQVAVRRLTAGDLPDWPGLLAGQPAAVVSLLGDALHRDPARRPASAAAFTARLNALVLSGR